MSTVGFLGSDTFTIIGHCEQTGMLGICVATSPIAVASRCPFVKAGVGAVSIQAFTDPRLGPLAIQLLEMGYSAPKVLKELNESDIEPEMRQIGIVDKDGNSAARSGDKNYKWYGEIVKKNYVAMGNGLTGEGVIKAMADAFEDSQEEWLEDRLIRAIAAGYDAGGQINGLLFSIGLLVKDKDNVLSRVDLRVDHNREPIKELYRILDIYRPMIPYYTNRPSNPGMGEPEEWLRNSMSQSAFQRYQEDYLLGITPKDTW